MPFDVFISHSSADKKIAEDLCAGLESAGLRCWIAPRNVTGGLDYADQISEAIQECPATLLVFSSASNESRHVKAEIDAAFGNGKILLPLRIEAVPPTKGMAHYLRNTHWLDALGVPTAQDIAHVAATLKNLIAGTPAPATPQKKAPAPAVAKSGMPPVIVFVLVGALLVVAGAIGVMFLKKAPTPTTQEVVETPDKPASPELVKVAGPFADAWIALGETDDLENAKEAFDLIEYEQPRAEALAQAYLKIGNRDVAMEVLANGGTPTKREEYEMAALEARAGAVKQALSTLRNTEKTGPGDEAVDTRLVILDYASGESETLGLEKADFDALLAEADELATKDETWEGTCRQLRVAQIKAVVEDTEGAAELIKTVEGQLPDPIDAETTHAVAELLRLYVILDDLKGAEALYARLKFKSDTDQAMLPLVEALIAADRTADAEKLAFAGPNPESQLKVVSAYLEANEVAAAATASGGEKATGIALAVLVGSAFREAGDEANAKLWLDKARAVALKDSSKEGQAKGLAEIARIEAAGGYSEAATKTMDEAKAKIGLP